MLQQTVVIACLVLAGLPALARPYAAHPERQFEAVIAEQGALLVRASQHEIARIHAISSDPSRRSAILGIARSALQSERPESDASLTAWLEFMNGRRGLQSAIRREPPDLVFRRAHRWVHALNRIRQLTGATQLAEEAVLPTPLLPRWKDSAAALCANDAQPLPGVDLPVELRVSLGVWKVGASVGLDHVLLGGKSCREFASDLLQIVHPHSNPTRPSHLEVFSPTLLRLRDADATTWEEGLRSLAGARRLNPDLDLVSAVREFLPGWPALRVLRLLGAVSHNHGIELSLLEQVLVRTPVEADAVRAATAVLSRMDHLYLLLKNFYGARFERPYHFHGAALVACELTARGYPARVTALTGNFLGEVYEQATSPGQTDRDDVTLHSIGTRYGIEICS